MNQKFCFDIKPGTKKTYYHKITQRKLLKTSKTLSFSLIQKRYLYLSNLKLGFIHFKKLFHESAKIVFTLKKTIYTSTGKMLQFK